MKELHVVLSAMRINYRRSLNGGVIFVAATSIGPRGQPASRR